jgi:hypothetical protein
MVQKNLKQKCHAIVLAFTAALAAGGHCQTVGFTDGFEIENWEKGEIDDGTTEMFGVATESAEFSYTVNLGNPGPGVTNRTADFTITAPFNANITFDWEFTGNHRWFQAFGEFHVIVDDEEVISPVNEEGSSGGYNYIGFDETFSVEAGDTFGFRIGGQNFDSSSILNGLLRVSNFRVEETAGSGVGLIISKSETTPGTFDLEWTSRTGKVYDLLSSTDLSTPVESWAIWDGQADIPAADEITRIEALVPEGSKRFFVVIEKSSP